MKRTWKKQTQASILRGIQKTTNHDRQIYDLTTAGLLGRNYQCDNAHKIAAAFHYNGSGEKAFGGADQWPHVTLTVSFQEGQVAERDAFVVKLQRWLDKNLPK